MAKETSEEEISFKREKDSDGGLFPSNGEADIASNGQVHEIVKEDDECQR